MKRLHGQKNGPVILYELSHTVRCRDEWGEGKEYVTEYSVMLLWYGWTRFRWMIRCPDFSCCEKRLSECAVMALRHMEEDSPRYYRLKEHLDKKAPRWRDA